MANKSAQERYMIQQDTEADKDVKDVEANRKASHGNTRSDSQFDRKIDFDLEDDINSIEER